MARAMAKAKIMKKILILGAGGQVAQWVIRALAGRDNIALTLLLRNPGKLPTPVPPNGTVLAGAWKTRPTASLPPCMPLVSSA